MRATRDFINDLRNLPSVFWQAMDDYQWLPLALVICLLAFVNSI